MPRKPSSLFVLVEPAISQIGQNPTPAQAYRFRLDETTSTEDILEREYQRHPAGSRVFVVEDTKVDAYTVGVKLEPVDDPRLEEEHG
jgi:hypothetical protein